MIKLSDKAYKIIKWLTAIAFPAVGTLYFGLASVWNFPYGEEVLGTITSVMTFLGVILGVSTSNYNKSLDEDECEDEDIEEIED